MGSVHTAACDCGFLSDVTVGGGRHTFLERSLFPFFCHQCGLVEVNVAKLSGKEVSTACPQCQLENATQYGTRPVSVHDMRRSRRRFWEIWKRDASPLPEAVLDWSGRRAAETGHLCPACHKMTLRFSEVPSLMFD
jgi:hypothetical protein